MFRDAKFFHDHNALAKPGCRKLVDSVVPQMSFDEEDIVLDIGCGPGDNTRDIIKAGIPKLKKLVAIDVLPEMIKFARENYPDDKIEYHLANIEDRNFVKTWEGSISKAFSVQCFYMIKDQRNAFQNLYDLLKPNGEAALTFMLSITHWDCFPEILNHEKWNKYLKGQERRIADSHRFHLGADHYKKLLEDLGFEVLLCKEEERYSSWGDDNVFKRTLETFSALPSYIPEDMREEFLDYFAQCMVKLEGRSSEGQMRVRSRNLIVHIRKH